ncbi:hypothetical protein PB2503_05152 [Parvularcula bermudensis HTCC2503]|uniref:Ribosomal RNA large subunit methyltransferase H n=1 Tax=Parvularcula bermudensis (strain ATCC BAA-594 / HTCC2503 / KCTC 12087) TaxID=314260 RepID=E0TFU0_PARBH|nr:23S rRNA (pseudouridine(1915)-N(3))-methyltransferase RlmH [Parvularcula bermudensis]ADM09105.1 hypothetical protein PB2503_05152 [Parvularcula bermudensis HTCC2503]
MLRLEISAIGRDRRSPLAEITSAYLERAGHLSRHLGIEGPSLQVYETPKAPGEKAVQAREWRLLAGDHPRGQEIILLDEGGRDMKSADFAALIAQRRDQGEGALRFLIGGASGFPASVKADKARFPHRLAFGRATWPHLMIRAMLAEQLYRALTIMSGHPYHREG